MDINNVFENIHNGEHEKIKKQLPMLILHDDSDELFNIAEELLDYGFDAESKMIFEELHRRFPEEKSLLLEIAEILIIQGNEEEALLILERIEPDDECYAATALLLADCYESFGMTEVSERKLEEAVKHVPDEPLLKIALGDIYAGHSDFVGALEMFTIVENSKFEDVDVTERIGECLLSLGKFEEAIVYFEKINADEKSVEDLLRYGFALLQVNEYQKAVKIFETIIEMDPEYYSAYYYIAIAHNKLNELDKSLAHAKKGYELDPYNKELPLFIAQTHARKGDHDDAIKLLQEAIAIDPSYLEAIIFLSKLFINTEMYDEALDLINETKFENETDPQFDWILASIYNGLEEFDKARKFFIEASKNYIDSPEFLEEYGQFLLEDGKASEAREIFEKLVELKPENAEYSDVLERMS